VPAASSSGSWDRQFAAKANAFNAGYERLKHLRFDLIGNLDDGTDDIVKSHAADVHWIELMRIPHGKPPRMVLMMGVHLRGLRA
jgi:hypothetical protein